MVWPGLVRTTLQKDNNDGGTTKKIMHGIVMCQPNHGDKRHPYHCKPELAHNHT